jgi:cell filamentation protein
MPNGGENGPDREVRAVWNDADSHWWFSVLDIVGVLNDQDNYEKNRNYWKYLKVKLKGRQHSTG